MICLTKVRRRCSIPGRAQANAFVDAARIWQTDRIVPLIGMARNPATRPAAQARSDAERSGGVAGYTVAAITRIEHASAESLRIIAVSNHIALKTNLFALNAEVEGRPRGRRLPRLRGRRVRGRRPGTAIAQRGARRAARHHHQQQSGRSQPCAGR